MASVANQETFAFQAEINQLLSLIINTFYSKKDVFLRELISNASDALDKIRYASLTDKDALKDAPDLHIQIIPKKEEGVLIIRDTGVGMTKDDLIRCLGTIAHSGTKAFLEAMTAKQDVVSLIGQFGVGFYAAFLVADKVTVRSKHNSDDTGYIWESMAGGSFTIAPDPEPLPRGTEIVLHLKEDQKEYVEENSLKTIVKTHSEYITFPIQLWVEREEEVADDEGEGDGEDAKKKEEEEPEEGNVEDVSDAKPKKTKRVKKQEWACLNAQKPVWTRAPEDVTKEEYSAFYKAFSQDWDDYLDLRHFKVDGQLQFTSLLFVPKRAPFDMFQGRENSRHNIKLHVRRVFITDDCKDLFPEYLGFVKGIVDSDDLPLNISREMLQQNKLIKVIRKNLVKKSLEMFKELAEDEDKEKYKQFYQQFSKAIKLGVHEDSGNRDKLVELLRYTTTKCTDNDQLVSLADYVTRMKEGQKDIYYLTGEDANVLKNSPCIEMLKKKGYEVLLMVDPIDEYVVQHVREYQGKKLVCCSREGLDLGEADEAEDQAMKELEEQFKSMCEAIKSCVAGVSKVVLSKRIDATPCILVADQYGWSANMERIMRAQTLHDSSSMSYMRSQRILELNPKHPIVLELKRLHDTRDKNEGLFKKLVQLMYDTTVLGSGFSITNPSEYAAKIYNLMAKSLSLDEGQSEGEDEAEGQVEETIAEPSKDSESIMEQLD
jgi:molecular chaperone HtpG